MPIEERRETNSQDSAARVDGDDAAAIEAGERDDIAHAYSAGTPPQAPLYGRRRDDPGGPVMHHSRASDDGSEHLHQRASDRTRWRFDTGHAITLATTLISTLVIVLSTYYTLRAEVDLNSDALHRIESTAKSKESADSDLKVVLTKLEELDRRISERLARIEANQERTAPAGGWR